MNRLLNRQIRRYGSTPLWTLLLTLEAVILAALYFAIGKGAFFLLGPLLFYNGVLYLLPYFQMRQLSSQHYKGQELAESQKILTDVFAKKKRLKTELRLLHTELDNVLVWAKGSRLWVISGQSFWLKFSEPEKRWIFESLLYLHQQGRLHSATFYSSLAQTGALWPLRTRSELYFQVREQDLHWHQMLWDLFHRMSFSSFHMPRHLVPLCAFPALGDYSSESYFSLYTRLRERLIKALKLKNSAFDSKGEEHEPNFIEPTART